MRKLLLLTAVAVLIFAGSTNAQIFSEDFESVTANEPISLADWTNEAEDGTGLWIGKTYDGNSYAQFSSYNTQELNKAYLVTPTIDLSNATNPVLSFDVNIGYWTHDALTVKISDDYSGDVYTATWDDVTSNFTIPQEPTGDYGTFASAGSMDVSSYTQTINIAFQYDGDIDNGETTTIQVDNVLVEEATNVNDIAASTTVNVFPNPTNGQVSVSSKTTMETIDVLNIIGQKIFSDNVNSNHAGINFESLKSGIYFIRTVDVDGNISITKVVKK